MASVTLWNNVNRPIMKSTLALGLISTVALGATALFQSCFTAGARELKSPDGKISVNVGVNDGRFFYTVSHNGSAVLDTSYISISLKEARLGENSEIIRTASTSFDDTWKTVWGEEEFIRNHYNELKVDLVENDSLPKYYSVTFRVFDDGVGFRYSIPEQEHLSEITVLDEDSQFVLAEDALTWSIPWDHEYYEHLYETSLLSRLDTVAVPLTMKVTDNLYLSIHEAALTDYAAMNLRSDKGTTCLHSYLTPWSSGEKVFTRTPVDSPWRTVIIAEKPGDLMLSRMMLNLNEPCALDDVSWIEPGRYIGIWWGMHMKDYTWEAGDKHGATTENTKRYIDFAAAHGFSGVLVEGWNLGWDGDWSANGDKFSFTTPYPDFDIKEITDYAARKGVRLIGHHETGGAAANYEAQMDSAFALYNSLGVNAVKTGYVNLLLDKKELHHSQYGVRHYRKVIENAARHHIMIDNHEPVMPTGLQRTYPNLMTQEGVRGQEYNAWSPDGGNPPSHTCIIPFTRCLAGPVDFTPGIFNFNNKAVPGTRPNTTVAKQLALAVVLYSPLQMASDMIENYENRPEFEFVCRCPTTWSRTVVPEAKIGEFLTVARKDRSGDDWFIGSITNERCHDTKINLDFLDDDCEYTAKIFADGEQANYQTNPYLVDIKEIKVNSRSVLPLRLAKGGGAAVILSKN